MRRSTVVGGGGSSSLNATQSGDHTSSGLNNTTNGNNGAAGSSSAELTRLRNRNNELEEQFAHIREEANARVRVLEESLAREQARNRDREEKETSKRQELISKVHGLTEERASLRAQLSQQHDVEDEIARLSSELKESRKECVELKTKALDEKRNFDEQLRDRQRTVEKQAQDISDLQCKLAIVEHKLQLAVARLGQHDSQAENLTSLEEQTIRLSEKLKATERDRRTEKDASDAEKASLRQRIRDLETELHSERDGVSKAEIIADYEAKIEGAHRMLRSAFANQSMIDMTTATSGASPSSATPQQQGSFAYNNQNQQQQQQHNLLNSHASFSQQKFKQNNSANSGTDSNQLTQRSMTMTGRGNNELVGNASFTNFYNPNQRSSSTSNQGLSHQQHHQSSSFAVQGNSINTGSGANLSQLSEALHLLDDPQRAESLIRRYIDSAVAARSATTASFTAASGLPDATTTDKTALLVQLANVTSERDNLRQQLNNAKDSYGSGDDRSSTAGGQSNYNSGTFYNNNNREQSQRSAAGGTSTPNNNVNVYRNGMLPSSKTPPKFNRSA